jgi:predicted peptidase
MYTKHKWESDKYFNFGYVKYLPKNYDPNKKYPLVFFLHGAGERGDDLDAAMHHGYMKYVRENNAEYPFVFIAPQCPLNKYWGCYTESLLAFLDFIIKELNIDEDRVYLTGLSMGGTGTWHLAMAAPDKFAAIVPICGTGIVWNRQIISHIPTMVYHGDQDPIVPISESINMVSNINKFGGNAKLQICYGVDHGSWNSAYTDEELIKWMLEQHR